MVRPEEITQLFGTKWFSGLAGAFDWFFNIMIGVVIVVGFYMAWVFIEHKIKVTYFPIFGPDIKKITEETKYEDLKLLNIQVGHPKKMRARDMKVKGVAKISLLAPPYLNVFRTRKLPPIDYEKRYSDGIFMLRPDKYTFIPIARPSLTDAINLRVPEADMNLWQEAEEAEVRRRTQDEGTMKRHLILTAGIIIGAFILAGVIIWLSMSFAGNSLNQVLDRVSPIADSLRDIAGDRGPG